jgi:hypothetical protein
VPQVLAEREGKKVDRDVAAGELAAQFAGEERGVGAGDDELVPGFEHAAHEGLPPWGVLNLVQQHHLVLAEALDEHLMQKREVARLEAEKPLVLEMAIVVPEARKRSAIWRSKVDLPQRRTPASVMA